MPAAVPGRSSGIDALRGLAVLMVLLHHSYVPVIGVPVYDQFLRFFREYGSLGVDLFFVLSGFCIHNAYSSEDRPLNVGTYLSRRWWRIYPPYLAALLLAVALNLITNAVKWKAGMPLTPENYAPGHILAHLFLVHNLSPSSELTISGPFWTIAMEAQYYLLYLAVRRCFFSRKGWAGILMTGLVLYFVAWRLQSEPWAFQPLSPLRYWIEWLLGAAAVYWVRRDPVVPQRIAALAAGMLACLVLAVGLRNSPTVDPVGLLARLAFALMFFFMIPLILGQGRMIASRFLNWLPGIGLFSYSIYLIHFLFMDRIRVFAIPLIPEGAMRLLASLSTAVFCVGASYVFYRYFERPCMLRSSNIGKSAGAPA